MKTRPINSSSRRPPTYTVGDPVTQWAQEVAAGDIIAGPHVRNAAKRHLHDLEHGPSRGLRWDVDAANYAIDFFEIVLKLNGGQFEGLPFLLHPSQKFRVGSLFGWKREDNTRRFRRFFDEEAKGNGKALALDTPIPTPTGWTTMGDLKPGDQVFDERGQPCNVLAVSGVMTDRPCYAVEFDDGARIVADEGHLWLTEQRRFSGTRDHCRGIPKKDWVRRPKVAVRTTKHIAETVSYPNGKFQSANHSVLLAEPLSLGTAPLPVDPYVLGFWLGDGDSDQARVTVGRQDCEDSVACLVAAGAEVTYAEDVGDKPITRYRLGRVVAKRLRTLGVFKNKHIPAVYLRASYEQRMAIIAGLMDTDGTVNKLGACEFSVCNKRLAEGFAELIWSVGIKAVVLDHPAKLKGREVARRYRIQFWPGDKQVFRLPRKAARLGVKHSRRRLSGDRRIVSCEPVPSVPVQCIAVDSPSHLFLAGRQMVPTHNSPLLAGIGMLCLVADGEDRAEIYAAASKKDQAMVLFRDAVAMWQQSPDLNNKLKPLGGNPVWNLAYTERGGFFRPISSEDGQSGPRPSCALCDEVHEHRNGNMIEMLERGFKWRRQPLLCMATNSGSDRNSVCWEEHQHAIRVAAGTREPDAEFTFVGDVIDDSTFSFVCSLDPGDDPLNDPSCWAKANPLLGVTVQPDYLAGVARQAKDIPGKMNNILRLHFCVWTDAEQAWMSRPVLESCLSGFDPNDYTGEKAYVGLDLSATQDLAAMAIVVPTGRRASDNQTTYAGWVEVWTPGDTVNERALRDNAPYDLWVRDGWLEAPPGKRVRFDFMAARLAEISGLYDIQLVAYDTYGFGKAFEPEMDELGLTLPIAEHPQGGKKKGKDHGLWMPGSKMLLENLMLEGRIMLRKSPVLISAIMSASIEEDPFGNAWFSKRRALSRIDPLVALAMAVGATTSVADNAPVYDIAFL